MLRRPLLIASLIAALLACALASSASAQTPRTSLNDISDEVMCVVCGVPLNVAESPQADRQRAFINELIAQGQTKEQIKEALKAEYGEAVLATPGDAGFGVTNWLVPALVVVALLGAVAILLPRWRRRDRAAADTAGPGAAAASGPEITPEEARRLDEDLSRYR